MRVLFEFDKKNYKENGSIFKRPSARAIVLNKDKLAMVHSLKYNYYKLPGGGIEISETKIEALVREVKEEAGLLVKEETVKEFGYVKRIEKGSYEDIFLQENFYYLCEVYDEVFEQSLSSSEKEDEFILEYVCPLKAIETNEKENHGQKSSNSSFCSMIERENKVLRVIYDELIVKHNN